MSSVPAVAAVVAVLIGMPRVSSSIRSAAPVAVAATTSRSAWAIASRISRRRTFLTALNIAAVACRTAMKSGCVSSSPAIPPSTLRVAARSSGSMPLGGRSAVAGVSAVTRDSTTGRMGGTCYRATVSLPAEAVPRRIHVSAAVIMDADGRLLLVRKEGTTAFMQPGGKPEPGESPSETLSRELAEELGSSWIRESSARGARSRRPRRTSRASSWWRTCSCRHRLTAAGGGGRDRRAAVGRARGCR